MIKINDDNKNNYYRYQKYCIRVILMTFTICGVVAQW